MMKIKDIFWLTPFLEDIKERSINHKGVIKRKLFTFISTVTLIFDS